MGTQTVITGGNCSGLDLSLGLWHKGSKDLGQAGNKVSELIPESTREMRQRDFCLTWGSFGLGEDADQVEETFKAERA